MIFVFDKFELDIGKFELRNCGHVVPVEPKVFAILQFLIENQDRLIPKNELVQRVWDGRAVSEWTISGGIKSARIAIGDIEKAKRYIRTIHGRGF